MVSVTMKELLEAGVHFGHQTRRWNPKMKEYIFGERNGIHIIDLQKTLKLFRRTTQYVTELAAAGKTLLFVGTKRQAQEAVAEEAQRCGMYFVNSRWLGGTLTNWVTLQKSIKRYKDLEDMEADGRMEAAPNKEQARMRRELRHFRENLIGLKDLPGLPDAIFVIDSRNETIAVKEAQKLQIPVVAVVDSNCDPDEADYPIPGNDDALRAIRLFASKISDAVLDGRAQQEQAIMEAAKAAEDAAAAEDSKGEVAAEGALVPNSDELVEVAEHYDPGETVPHYMRTHPAPEEPADGQVSEGEEAAADESAATPVPEEAPAEEAAGKDTTA